MRGDDRRGLTCPREIGVPCPITPCPGEADPRVCRYLRRLQGWRALTHEVQNSTIWAGESTFEPSHEPTRGRLRVGLWCPCLGLGGAEVWQLALARAVDSEAIAWKGVAVIEGRGSTDPRMVREIGSMMPVGYGLNAARTLASSCDLIVTWAVTSISSLLGGLDHPPRVVMACHFPGESPWGPGTGALLEGVDCFVAVSELALESTPPAIRDRVEVIWNAVDPRRLAIQRNRREIRGLWGVPQDAPVVGYLGRLSPEKDPDAMIRLATELPSPWHVVIVGEGRERESLHRKTKSVGLDRVHLVGGETGVGDVLGAFDSLIVPSYYESFGLTLAEGLWAGVPVIATRSGLAKLVPGLVREIQAGADGRELADAILADRIEVEATRARVERARSFAREKLGLDRFGRDWTNLLLQTGEHSNGRVSCSIPS